MQRVKEFYWEQDTLDYYTRHEETNGWPSTATRILEYVTHECDLEEGETEGLADPVEQSSDEKPKDDDSSNDSDEG